MKNIQLPRISGKKELILPALEALSYIHHNGGYVKYIDDKYRFHVKENEHGFFIHIDKTINNYHNLLLHKGYLTKELSAINEEVKKQKIQRRLLNEEVNKINRQKKKEKKAKKNEYAPNLQELQKNNKTKISFFDKLRIVKDLFFKE